MRERFSYLVDQIKSLLYYMQDGGFTGFDCSESVLNMLEKLHINNISTKNEDFTLDNIFVKLGGCKRCSLCKYRKNIVFGEGNSNAKLVFVGEGPGFEEDRTGRPFVGSAGQLLTKIIGSMNLTRSDVYICNVVKCRPPGNRNPNFDEIEKCIPFLKWQISVIRPKIVCLLGSVASKSLLSTNLSISKLRGKFVELPYMTDVMVMPTYHPAYLLRNPLKKKEVWNDIQKIIEILK